MLRQLRSGGRLLRRQLLRDRADGGTHRVSRAAVERAVRRPGLARHAVGDPGVAEEAGQLGLSAAHPRARPAGPVRGGPLFESAPRAAGRPVFVGGVRGSAQTTVEKKRHQRIGRGVAVPQHSAAHILYRIPRGGRLCGHWRRLSDEHPSEHGNGRGDGFLSARRMVLQTHDSLCELCSVASQPQRDDALGKRPPSRSARHCPTRTTLLRHVSILRTEQRPFIRAALSASS
mmetsp:Transcript_15782/g.31457  ORF Transcript_15782/g.31457 Transcript_15782/m.31457 type:complete len:231 (-) Transcript_15782:1120-1812(-)